MTLLRSDTQVLSHAHLIGSVQDDRSVETLQRRFCTHAVMATAWPSVGLGVNSDEYAVAARAAPYVSERDH